MNKLVCCESVLHLLLSGSFAGGILPAVAGCPAMPGVAGAADEAPSGAKLVTTIMQKDPFQLWAQFPDHRGIFPSILPHGPMSQVFINRQVESTLTGFTGALPNGSIIVKQNIGTSPAVTEAALTVMWKVTGFDPENNDWFWANLTQDGQIVSEGKIAACAACHGGARANDFVFVHEF